MKRSSAEWRDKFLENIELADESFVLKLGASSFQLQSNSDALLQELKSYFAHVVVEGVSGFKKIIAIEAPPVELNLPFFDWIREEGKTGRKDACFNLDDGRLIYKVRTGMLFLQSYDYLVAIGPCEANPNQVINFVNSQFMNHLLHREWLICHAACLTLNGNGVAIAGFSGGGKSTLMLKLMDHDSSKFSSNDRLFIRSKGGVVESQGIPKLPRINPGTIANNPRLRSQLSEERLSELDAMPKEELWHLEEKYDVDISQVYGKDRLLHETKLDCFVILSWKHDSNTPTAVTLIELNERKELLKAIMKTPGPFYQDKERHFLESNTLLAQEPYLEHLSALKVYEVTGRVDFAAVKNFFLENHS